MIWRYVLQRRKLKTPARACVIVNFNNLTHSTRGSIVGSCLHFLHRTSHLADTKQGPAIIASLATMRIPPVAMALLAVAARGALYRANSGVFVAAFSTASRAAFSSRTTDGSSSASPTIGRRRRTPHSSDSLLTKVKELQKQGKWSEETMMFSAVEETATEATTTSDDVIAFPQAGKRIEDCAPRMRFAPSPTGR